jgi:GTPase SAR1 family protein
MPFCTPLTVSLLMSRYVVDSAEMERIPESKEELFELLERPVLAGIPLLVLGNKKDLREAIPVEKLIDEMFVLFEVKTD